MEKNKVVIMNTVRMRDMEDRAGNLVRAHTCTRMLTQNFRETHYVLLHQATFTGHLLHGRPWARCSESK